MPPVASRAGDRALLIDYGSVSAAALHIAAERARQLGGVIACIAGQRSLYVLFDHDPRLDEVAEYHGTAEPASGRTHRLAVSFRDEYAPELPGLLARIGMAKRDFMSGVAALRLTARYLGFRAGFAYLDGWPEAWAMPRRPTSRPVLRGSFGIAHATAGFYPIDTPGGWNILGRTDAPLWDALRHPPNLISAGDEILIDPHERPVVAPEAVESAPLPIEGFEILANAQFSTVVAPPDWSRSAAGLSAGGAFDVDSATTANAIAGNDSAAPTLECALMGPRLCFLESGVVVWCGAESDLPQEQPVAVQAGQEISVGRIRGGLRGWLAFRRGEESPARPGRAGGSAPSSRLGMTDARHGHPHADAWRDRLRIAVVAGPHESPLRTVECEVTPHLNRVGIRLRPLRPVGFAPPADLASCGMQPGTIQLHPDGTLVAMGPDHPITGGYLQPLTVKWDEKWKLAQLAPGDRVVLDCA